MKIGERTPRAEPGGAVASWEEKWGVMMERVEVPANLRRAAVTLFLQQIVLNTHHTHCTVLGAKDQRHPILGEQSFMQLNKMSLTEQVSAAAAEDLGLPQATISAQESQGHTKVGA